MISIALINITWATQYIAKPSVLVSCKREVVQALGKITKSAKDHVYWPVTQ